MNLSLRALGYVVAAADLGGVSAAARRLNVSQPSVSAAIAQLEADIGVQLFIRHHARGITPTAAGERLLAEARGLLSHAEDFAAQAQSLGAAPRGHISIGCFVTLAPRCLPPLLSAFAREHPGITVSLEEGDQSGIIEALRSGRTEFALSYDYALPAEISGETLAAFPPYAVLPTMHPRAAAASISLHELAGEPFLLLDLPHSRDYFTGLFTAAGVVPRIGFRSRSMELIRGMVAHGQGWTLLNMPPSRDDPSPLAAVRLRDEARPVQVVGLTRRGAKPRPAIAAFASFARTAFAQGGLLDATPQR